MDQKIYKYKEEIIDSGIATPDQIRGFSHQDLAWLDSQLPRPLPGIYRRFLLAMGRHCGRLYLGSELFFDRIEDLLRMRDWAVSFIHECGDPFELDDNAFVFFDHCGAMFYFFILGEGGDDPPIYIFEEGDTAPRKALNSFSEFLEFGLKYSKTPATAN